MDDPRSEMGTNTAKTDLGTMACVAVSIAIGVFVLLTGFGVIPSKGDTSELPLCLAIGSVFIFGGLAVLVQTVAARINTNRSIGMESIKATQFLLSLGIILSFAVIQTWIAFGPGERHFRISLLFIPEWANEPIGRTLFAIGAALCWIVFLAAFAIGVSRLRNRD